MLIDQPMPDSNSLPSAGQQPSQLGALNGYRIFQAAIEAFIGINPLYSLIGMVNQYIGPLFRNLTVDRESKLPANYTFILSAYPCKNELNVNAISIGFELDPVTGVVTVILPQTMERIGLLIDYQKPIWTNPEETTLYKFVPRSKNTSFEVLLDGEPPSLRKKYNFHSNKLTPPPKIIPREERGEAINSLISKNPNFKGIVNVCETWIGKGNYAVEGRGLWSAYEPGKSTKILNMKVVSYLKAGVLSWDAWRYRNESLERLENKTATMNCWQFCLLSYIEAGVLSWKTVGLMHKALSDQNRPVTDALKYGKTELFERGTIPNPGDMVLFSPYVDEEAHCVICQEHYDYYFNHFSYYEISRTSKHVAVNRTPLENCRITIIRAEDLENNILNFLASQSLGSDHNNL